MLPTSPCPRPRSRWTAPRRCRRRPRRMRPRARPRPPPAPADVSPAPPPCCPHSADRTGGGVQSPSVTSSRMTFWTVERRGDVALATFTRPPRNLMSMAAMGELEQLAGEIAAEPDIAVLVLTGGVDGYFVAHADLDDLTRLGKGEA